MSLRDRLNKSGELNNPILNQVNLNQESQENDSLFEYQKVREKVHYLLIDKVNTTENWDKYSDEQQKQLIQQFILKIFETKLKDIPLNAKEKQRLIVEITQEVKGYGPLDPLLADPAVSDILVNGSHHVYVEKNGKLYKTNVSFKDDKHLMNIIERIVSKVGRRIDEKTPMVDARLPDGSRVNAIIPPLALDGPSLSIRRFKIDIASLDNLLKWGSMTVAMAETLKAAVKARMNIVISGGTGAGKTTLLNSLSSQIPHDERIVTIEDSAELNLQQEHVVRLETRPANIEGEGAITTRDLVINSLRMRPDRVVIGECRGAESLDMLQAMNTGHDGSLTTLHANSPRDACSRLETMVMFSGVELPQKTIREQISSAVNIIVQASRLSDGTRRVTYITEVVGMEGNIITLQDIFKWEQYGLDEYGKVIGCHVATGVRPRFVERIKAKGIELPPGTFDTKAIPVYLCDNPPNANIPVKGNYTPTQQEMDEKKRDANLNQLKTNTTTDRILVNRLKNHNS